MSEQWPPGWRTDPFGRYEQRFWDGARWSEHVSSTGRQATDPPVPSAPPSATPSTPATPAPPPMAGSARVGSSGQPPGPRSGSASPPPTPGRLMPTVSPPPGTSSTAKNVQRRIDKAGLVNPTGNADLSIFGERVLVISQKGKLVELRAEYAIYGQGGHQLAAVRGKRMSSRIEVVDMHGRRLLDLRREGSVVSTKVAVSGPNGARIGRIVNSQSLKHVQRMFKLEGATDQLMGGVYGEDSRRHREFNIQNDEGIVVARLSKTHAGVAKELLTKADNYVLSFEWPLDDPLRMLSIASALVVDTRLHQGQDNRRRRRRSGFGL